MTMADAPSLQTVVSELEASWKELRGRLVEEKRAEDFRIRMHRAFSWLKRSARLEDDPDTSLMLHWVAFNALFGRWDTEAGRTVEDSLSRHRFVEEIFGFDRDGKLAKHLTSQRELVMAILDDEYVAKHFWVDPGDASARRAKRERFDARTWYVSQNYRLILDKTLARVYLVRCQLMHGAATHGSQLNRDSIQRCSDFLASLLLVVLTILIERGEGHDWSGLCYPPQW